MAHAQVVENIRKVSITRQEAATLIASLAAQLAFGKEAETAILYICKTAAHPAECMSLVIGESDDGF